MAPYNLSDVLINRRLSAGDADRVAVESGTDRWTYADVAALVDRAAHTLRAAGVERGERVLIVLPDSVDFIAVFLGAIKIGAVAVPCSTFLGPGDYRYFLRESGARVVVTNDELSAQIESDVRILKSSSLKPQASSLTSHASRPTLQVSIAPAQTSGEDPAFWLWTSGTTGEPKAAVHRHQDPQWCCQSVGEDVLAMTAADRVYSAAKLFHAYGLGNALFFPFWTGAAAVLYPERARAEAVFALLHHARPTIFFGVPTLFAAMLQIDDAAERFDLSSLRCCMSAAEPLPAELFERWRRRFDCEILDGIGSTEMLHTYIASRPGRVRPGSAGFPVAGYEIRVVDEAGQPAGVNRTGDLLVKGPSVAALYWNRPEETASRMRDGWFASGDKFLVDGDGYYWYAGRSDDMFKVSGEWVSPAEVEALLVEHPQVLECAVVPWPESSGVLKPKACVVLKTGVTASHALAGELQHHVRDRAAHYKCPRTIEFVAELPKTATGKIQRYKLRKGVRS